MYRLHIDIPLDCDLETAKKIGMDAVNAIIRDRENSTQSSVFLVDELPDHAIILESESNTHKIEQLNYRLGNDEDRQKSNYYIMDSRGHVTHKKCVVTFGRDEVSQPRTV